MFYKNNGFTLVEIIISIVILSIITIIVLPVFNHIFNSIFSAGDKTSATYTSQKFIVDEIQKNNGTANIIKFTNNSNDYSIDVELYESLDNYTLPNNNSTKPVNLYYYKYITQ